MRSRYLVRIMGILLMICNGFIGRANADDAPLNGGCITSPEEWVLIGNIPSTITTTVATGGNCGSYSYQWQQSADNIFFTDIPGATSQNLAFTATLSVTTYFQRKVTCGSEVAYTGSVAKRMTSTQFFNVAMSQNFTRNNCAAGAVGSTVPYTVPANRYSSLISQADANAKAQNDINANGQNYANSNGTCTWYNALNTVNFSKNNCASGGVGSVVPYTVPAGKYSSAISQADADAKAQTEITNNGQTNANTVGYCTWYNAARSSTFTRNNCLSGTIPTAVTYNVPAAKHSSTTSQADADQKAIDDVNANGQNYANTNGSCINLFFSFKPNGGSPGPFGISVKSLSGTLLFSRSLDRDFSADTFQTAVVPEASSYIVEMAAQSPMYAIVNGVQKSVLQTVSWSTTGNTITIIASQTPRYYNVTKSGTFIRNNCGSGFTGGTVTYTVGAGTYWSDVSQSDADQQAQNAVNANGQAYANANGSCTANQNVSVVLRNSFVNVTTAFTVSFYRNGAFQQTNNFPLTKGASTTIQLPAGSYTMTFNAPSAVLGAPYSYILTPPGSTWSPAGSLTVTTGTVTYNFGTSYTLNISSFD